MKRFFIFFVGWALTDACVDRINFDIPGQFSNDLVVDGLITDEPGPYTVKLSRSIKVDDTRPLGIPVNAKSISIHDNAGNSETLNKISTGFYQTKPDGIQGVIGREYFIRIEMDDGNIFESLPDKMNPVGAIDSIYYDFESYQPETAPTAYRYRIYIDAHNTPEGSNYFRWKFNGTYEVETLPQYTHCPDSPCSYCPTECSGYAWVDGELKKGYAYNPKTKKVEYFGLECTCCRCWVTAPEAKPKVSDLQISASGKFVKVEMGTIPVNFYTFFEKYRVEILQMSLSRVSFDYWKAIESQKDASGSLFQPITGKIPTNIFEKNNAQGVQGIFYASATTKKQIYLDKNTHRVEIYVPLDGCTVPWRAGAIGKDCRIAFPGSTSTTQKPEDWKF
ncbi:MAG: DUF4249 domain-containing protein [Bacteroidota bacterium]